MEQKESLLRRATGVVARNCESVVWILLTVWCVLPLVVAAYDVTMGLRGEFPILPDDVLHSRTMYYVQHVNYYFARFQTIGLASLAFAALAIVLSWRRVLSLEGIKRHPWMYLLGALLAWAVVCARHSEDFTRAFYGDGYLNDGLLSYFMYAGLFVCATMARTERSRRMVLQLFCVVVAVLAGIIVAQEAGVDSLDLFFPSGRAAVFNQFNHFGYVLCMAVCASAGLYLHDGRGSRALRAAYLAGFVFLSYALLVNDTFGAYLASAFALVLIYVYRRVAAGRLAPADFLPLAAFALVSAVSIAGPLPSAAQMLPRAYADESAEAVAEEAPAEEEPAVSVSAPDTKLGDNLETFKQDIENILEGNDAAARAGSTRYTLWKDTLGVIARNPIFGVGPMGLYGDNMIFNGDAPHNEYLTVAAYLGIPGLVLYLGALGSLAFSRLRRLRTLSPTVVVSVGIVTGYLASACFGNPVFNSFPFFWLFLGFATATSEAELPLVCIPGAEDLDLSEGENADGEEVAA